MAVISVLGAKGGCGVSLLATNLGVALAAEDSCLLIDLNPLLGYDDLLLDVSIQKTWLDLLPVAGELTEHHLELAIASHASGLRLLGAPQQRGGKVRRVDLVKLLKGLRARFQWILLDMSSARMDLMAAAFTDTDLLLLLSTLDPQSLRAAKRLAQELPQELSQNTGMAFNQIMPGHPVKPKAVVASLGLPLLAELPYDQRAVGRQVNFGGPCVADSRSHYGRAVVQLAARLSVAAARGQTSASGEDRMQLVGGDKAKEDAA